jgi:nickel transport protein
MKVFNRFCILLVVWLLMGGDAMAHKVNLFAYVESGTVYTESYFPDGRMVENGGVSVYDSADKLLLEGKTDKEGLFNFPVPKVDGLTIVLDAGMGHKASFKLQKADIEAAK